MTSLSEQHGATLKESIIQPTNATARIALVYPTSESSHGMIFARRTEGALRARGAIVLRYELRTRTDPCVMWKERAHYRSFLEQERINIVHAHYGTATAAFCALSSSLPLVITYCGSDLNPCPANNWVRWFAAYLLSQFATLRANRIVCVSEGLRRRLWWRKSIAAVCPNGVNLALFHPVGRAESRAALGWSEEPVVLFNAGLSPRVKRADLAERVFTEVRSVCQARLFVLRGDTDPRKIPIIMNAADCLLFTSDYEGSPNVVKEAVACGLPVVTVPVGDVAETLAGVEPSYIVNRDVRELAAAVVSVLKERRRANGAARAPRFSLDTQSTFLLELYASVLGTASRPVYRMRQTRG